MIWNINAPYTTNPFCYHRNNYKDNNKKAERAADYLQAHLLEHFACYGHNRFSEGCTITLIDKADEIDYTKREEYWRNVLKTVSSYGFDTVT